MPAREPWLKQAKQQPPETVRKINKQLNHLQRVPKLNRARRSSEETITQVCLGDLYFQHRTLCSDGSSCCNFAKAGAEFVDISYHIISLHKQSTNVQARRHYNLHQSTGVSVFTSSVSFDVFSRLRWASFPSVSSENNLFQREIRAFLFNLPYPKEVVAVMRKTPSQV